MMNSLGGIARPMSAGIGLKSKKLPNVNISEPINALGNLQLPMRAAVPPKKEGNLGLDLDDNISARKRGGVKAAKLISKFCQTTYRGRRARERVQLLRWHVANEAAKKIQRAFRRWKFLEFSRMHVSWTLKKKFVPRSMPWESFVMGAGNYQDKISIWRSVAELRRLHRDVSPELCFKALIIKKGDIGKASVILANSAVLFGADSRYVVTNELKNAMNPSEICSQDLVQQYKDTQLMSESYSKGSSRLGSAGGARHGRAVRAHRHLQESIMHSAGMNRSSDLPDAHIDLRNEIMKCYFSSNYSKSKSHSK